MKQNVKYAVTGALAGAANGFFGSGGGLFLVPMFTKWLGLEQKRAFATSVAVILPLSAVSLVIYFFRGGVDFLYALPFLLGGLAGGVISGRIFKKMPVTLLRRAFGLLILYGGIRAVLLLQHRVFDDPGGMDAAMQMLERYGCEVSVDVC